MKRNLLIIATFLLFATVAKSQIQSDTSDNYWSVVMPTPDAYDIDMLQVLVGKTKDSVVTEFVLNTGSWKFRVDSIYFRGADADAFSLVSGFPVYSIEPSLSHFGEFRFIPQRIGIHNAEIVIITQAETLTRSIQGEGVQPQLEVITDLINFGEVIVGNHKDTIQAVTIKNIGSAPLIINNTNHSYPNDVDFTTLAGGGNFTLQPEQEAIMDLRFEPSEVGRTSGTLEFHYSGVGSPAVVQLFGEGVKRSPQIIANLSNIPDLLCDSESSSLIEIRNSGDEDLIIGSFDFSGANPDDFSINETLPVTVQPDSIKNIQIIFRPLSAGIKYADLEIYSNADPDSLLKVQIAANKESAEYSALPQEIDLGMLKLDEETTHNLSVTNDGTLENSYSVTHTSGIVVTPTAFSLMPGETRLIEVTYPGSSEIIDIIEEIIITENLCNDEKSIEISGKAFSSMAEIQIMQIEGSPGDEINLELKATRAENLIASGITSIAADLTFNPTLLYPIGYDIERIDAQTAKIRIEDIPADAQAGEVLKSVKFIVGLGNAEECDLILSNAETVGGEADLSLINGHFRLLGVCREGGTRLINPTSESGITSISPNPTDGEIEIGLNLIEKGYTELALYNIMGEKISSVISENIEITGERTINLDISEYSSGLYFIVLKTPSHHFTEEVMILK